MDRIRPVILIIPYSASFSGRKRFNSTMSTCHYVRRIMLYVTCWMWMGNSWSSTLSVVSKYDSVHGDPVYRSVRERQTKPNVYTYIFFIFAQHFNIVPWRYNENNYVINALYLIVTYGVWHASKTRTSGIFCVIRACVNIFSLNDGQILRKHKVHNTVITWCNCITNMATLLCLWIY